MPFDLFGADSGPDLGQRDQLADDQLADQRRADGPFADQGPAGDGPATDGLARPDQRPADAAPVPDAALCGNGQLDSPQETCDKALPPGAAHACPQSCDDGNACTSDSLIGSVAACTARCEHAPVPGCCGNGLSEPGEQCDDGNLVADDGCTSSCALPGGHLLLSEVAVSPSDAEFVELYNPSNATLPLDNVYLSDHSDYFEVPLGVVPTGSGNDFTVRFPAGATIGPGQYVVIAIGGSSGFKATYGRAPDYELKNSEQQVPDMVAAVPDSVGSKAGLTDTGELLMLFSWDGTADLVQDLDYLVWKSSSAEAVAKSPSTCVDGPDPDNEQSCYLADTPVTSQRWLSPPASGGSLHRCNYLEGTESAVSGNGLSGHDETSEPFDLSGATWQRNGSNPSARTPGAPAPAGFCAQ